MAPHSSTLAWKIPWTEEPGRLQSMGSQRVAQDWVTSLSRFTFMHWRRKCQPTPVFLPGESQGRGSLGGLASMGSHRVGHHWCDLAAARRQVFALDWVLSENVVIQGLSISVNVIYSEQWWDDQEDHKMVKQQCPRLLVGGGGQGVGEDAWGVQWVLQELYFGLCLEESRQWLCLASLEHGFRGTLSEAGAVWTCSCPTAEHGLSECQVGFSSTEDELYHARKSALVFSSLKQLPLSSLHIKRKVQKSLHDNLIQMKPFLVKPKIQSALNYPRNSPADWISTESQFSCIDSSPPPCRFLPTWAISS